MWDLNSLTRDWTCTPCIGRRSLNHWIAREVPSHFILHEQTALMSPHILHYIMLFPLNGILFPCFFICLTVTHSFNSIWMSTAVVPSSPCSFFFLNIHSQIFILWLVCTRHFILFYFAFYKFISFILFLATLGLRCCMQTFSSCGERGLLFVAVHGLLIVVASLVVEHGL